MIALDTNVLVYAHREDSQWHDAAATRIAELAERRAPWAIPWPCIHEFLAIATHPQIYKPPSSPEEAIEQVEAWLESPSLVLLSESPDHWRTLRACIEEGHVSGPQVHDARIAALCRQHGILELWTVDRDFSRFPGLPVRNPLRR
jgi:toxin-antitoxin system PIN domain toxin